jgi:uncharacterized membrane protein
MTKVRLENFSDGVFAIAVTLLVLGIKIPDAKNLGNHQLVAAMLNSLPQLLTFGFSFMVIGTFWVAHHRIFAMAKAVDSRLLWLNVVYLMFVAVMPYPAALLAEDPFQSVSILVYCSTLVIIGMMHYFILRHIYHSEEVKNEIFTEDVFQSYLKTGLVGPGIYVWAAGLSFLSPYISFGLIVSSLVYYVFFSGIRLERAILDPKSAERRPIGRRK